MFKISTFFLDYKVEAPGKLHWQYECMDSLRLAVIVQNVYMQKQINRRPLEVHVEHKRGVSQN